MENKGKGPEKILAGFEKAYAPFIALPPHVKPFLMSSMANLLRWSAGQMSEKMRVDCDVLPLTVNVNNPT